MLIQVFLPRAQANDIADRLVSILHYNGMPIPNDCVVQGVIDYLEKEAAA